MTRTALIIAPMLALAACAGGPGPDRGPPLRAVANPSAVVTAELAFARLAQEKGQWTAFRATAAPDAEMFEPLRVKAADWLKGRADPPAAVKWQPHQIWSSCDGSAAVSHGAWQAPDGSTGYFTTVWVRQKDGRYRWLLDSGDALPMPLTAPEMIAARTAECGGKPGVPIAAPLVGADMKQGVARDQTLQWSSTVQPDGSRRIVVQLWNGKSHDIVLDESIAPSGN